MVGERAATGTPGRRGRIHALGRTPLGRRVAAAPGALLAPPVLGADDLSGAAAAVRVGPAAARRGWPAGVAAGQGAEDRRGGPRRVRGAVRGGRGLLGPRAGRKRRLHGVRGLRGGGAEAPAGRRLRRRRGGAPVAGRRAVAHRGVRRHGRVRGGVRAGARRDDAGARGGAVRASGGRRAERRGRVPGVPGTAGHGRPHLHGRPAARGRRRRAVRRQHARAGAVDRSGAPRRSVRAAARRGCARHGGAAVVQQLPHLLSGHARARTRCARRACWGTARRRSGGTASTQCVRAT